MSFILEKDKKTNDEYFMKEAIKEAIKALEKDEVPIGAVIVCNNKIISRTHNLTETLNDVTAHAEMQAFTSASDFIGGKYLDECVMYVTLEPCVMCAGASFWTHIGEIVYGCKDDKRGYSKFSNKILHPKTVISGGVLSEKCKEIIQNYFEKKRIQSNIKNV
jgi:tRNA(adenine34) deaminase